MKRLAIDIGSKTLKLVVRDDETGEVEFTHYLYHRSEVRDTLLDALHYYIWRYGDAEARVTVTGSAGMRLAELFDVPFVQEVVALVAAVAEAVPQADVVLEMGGEDTKLVYLTPPVEQRMNTICAGGTGGFIQMMAGLMGLDEYEMSRLAMGYTTIYPIASRCGVFAKSDVRSLVNAGARRSDIAGSVFEAVCTQAVAGLSCGRPIEGEVVLVGGPFEFNPSLCYAFCKVTGIDKRHVHTPPHAHLLVATGATLVSQCSDPMLLSQLEDGLRRADYAQGEGLKSFPPLFSTSDEYGRFLERHATHRIPRRDVAESGEHYFLGIDAGSTTVKIALVDEDGALVHSQYEWNQGDVSESLPEMLEEMYRQVFGTWNEGHVLRRSVVVGYGERFCIEAYRVDDGAVETAAHLRAAQELEPDVDFLMDIGGQDIKCFYIEGGQVRDLVLNEACSSGCGSLFDSVARSMHRKKESFAAEALFAEHPVDLGTRCSVFMDSRVKHAQKEGVPQADIAAGICYSTVRNALYKVVRRPDFASVGEHVVVQGGTFANDAMLRALEVETGVTVTRSDMPQIMGAWGAALLARDQWLSMREAGDPRVHERSGLLDAAELACLRIDRRSERCGQCTNACQLMVSTFESDPGADAGGVDRQGRRFFVTGNRCEKGALLYDPSLERVRRPPNMVAVENALIAAYDRRRPPAPASKKVGIPRVLALYESYPFWHTLFDELGYEVVAPTKTDEKVYRAGMDHIPAEGACYPSKLLFGHAADLLAKEADVLFVPDMGCSFSREGLLGLPVAVDVRDCPVVENAGSMLAGNATGGLFDGAALAVPDLRAARDLAEMLPVLHASLESAGICCSLQELDAACRAAQAEYRRFFDELRRRTEQVLARVEAGEFPGMLVAAHPYQLDPGVNHGVDELLGTLGYAVLTRLDFDFLEGGDAPGRTASWTENVETLHAARSLVGHPSLQLVVLRSFGCGIDALVADELHALLHGQGRMYAELKLDQIVDLAAVRIRLRSLEYADRQRRGGIVRYPVTANPTSRATAAHLTDS